jgi:hypothetical protein
LTGINIGRQDEKTINRRLEISHGKVERNG